MCYSINVIMVSELELFRTKALDKLSVIVITLSKETFYKIFPFSGFLFSYLQMLICIYRMMLSYKPEETMG